MIREVARIQPRLYAFIDPYLAERTMHRLAEEAWKPFDMAKARLHWRDERTLETVLAVRFPFVLPIRGTGNADLRPK